MKDEVPKVEAPPSPPQNNDVIWTPKGVFRKYKHTDGKVEVEFAPKALVETFEDEARADAIINNTLEKFKKEGSTSVATIRYKGEVYAAEVKEKVINPYFDPEYKHKPETKWGKRLFMVPPKGYKVTLNPNYDPQADNTFYCVSVSPDGKQVKQHYTQDFTKRSKVKKFEFIEKMGPKLNRIRNRYKADLKSSDPALRAHALAALLFDYLMFRAGNAQSEKRGVRGLTTLQARHVKVSGDSVDFNYTGKDSVKQHQYLRECPNTAKLVAAMLRGKGPKDYFLSWKRKDGTWGRVTADSANAYLSGIWKPLTTHKFRSFHATNEAREKLEGPVPKKFKESDKKLLKYMKIQLKSVTRNLGHKSVTTTMSHYVDPKVMHEFFERHDFKLPKTVFA
jgi:DNA topoisomerase IB